MGGVSVEDVTGAAVGVLLAAEPVVLLVPMQLSALLRQVQMQLSAVCVGWASLASRVGRTAELAGQVGCVLVG